MNTSTSLQAEKQLALVLNSAAGLGDGAWNVETKGPQQAKDLEVDVTKERG